MQNLSTPEAHQLIVDTLEQAARICDMIPEGRPKASFSGAIRAFIKGRYPENSPVVWAEELLGETYVPENSPVPDAGLHSIVVWANELLGTVDIPERNCSCPNGFPPCSDCVNFAYIREVMKNLEDAIKQYRGY